MGAPSSCRMAKLVEPSLATRKNDRVTRGLAVVDILAKAPFSALVAKDMQGSLSWPRLW